MAEALATLEQARDFYAAEAIPDPVDLAAEFAG